jgi:aspartate racemase
LKTIGLIGGMSWASTSLYYKIINQSINEKLGNMHSAKIIVFSIDFEELFTLQKTGRWGKAANFIIPLAKTLEKAGADIILICSNTGHEGSEIIAKSLNVPLLHIADSTGQHIISQNLQKVALLGTKFTMEKSFYKKRLNQKFGIEVIVPELADRNLIHDIIYNELCFGKIKQISKRTMISIINNLIHDEGAQGIILGCTELPLLINQKDVTVPIFDTTKIHALTAVDFAISK